ncbi:LLM class flavin-dependent oxidoreductase [Nonomuraea insulae]|uniref:LLM class flavin-dependent oxidoreductase n=1 Tax=Nonomuraea insulae TaxID=1616787 RepID=A0ABW1CP34_9ACTN
MEPTLLYWTLPGPAADLDGHVALCREAERLGVHSVLVPFAPAGPDPFAWAAALGRRTGRIGFLLECLAGVSSPTYWTQQANTLAAVLGGRVGVVVAAGWEPVRQLGYGDGILSDGWYARLDEFWQVCHGLWRGPEPVSLAGRHYQIDSATVNARFVSGGPLERPEISVTGPFPPALAFASRHADCVFVQAEEPEEQVAAVLDSGLRAGLAVPPYGIADATVPPRGIADATVPPRGIADETAAVIGRGRAAGATRFLMSGDIERLRWFGAEILPRIRSAVHNDAGQPMEGDTRS